MNNIINLIASPEFTYIFSLLIFISPFFLKKYHDKSSLQNIAVSLGIFGTFLGIFAGLLNFNTNDISSSIPNLLGGLKTAFLTSIAGSFSALLIKMTPFYRIDESILSVDEKNETTLMLEELQLIRKAIAGEEDASVVTQIQKMRTSIVDKQDDLNKAFDKFSESMVNSNIDALAEAIEKVMGDFNTTVNDKLSKAFDDFRKAVENLNIWQSEYKNNILSQTENLQTVKVSLDASVEGIESVKKSFNDIVLIKEKFDDLLKNLNAQLQGSLDFASSMKELTADLEGSGKVIKEEMKEITYGAATEMEKTMNKTLADFGSSLADISGKLAEDFGKIQQSIGESLSK